MRAMALPRASFEVLVRDHHARVWQAAQRILRDDALADDVTQEVYLALLRGRIDLSGAKDAGQVLRWRAVRTALAKRRQTMRRYAHEAEQARERTTTATDLSIEQADEAQKLWRAVDALEEELRLPVVLRFAQGLSYAEIGAALEIGVSSAHDRVRQGLARLRVRLAAVGIGSLRLEEVLAQDPTPRALPALEAKLLALRAPYALLGIATPAWIFSLFLGVAALWWVPRDKTHEEGTTVALDLGASSQSEVGRAQEPLAVTSEFAPALRASAGPAEASLSSAVPTNDTTWLEARVLAQDFRPIAGLRVLASTVELAGKRPAKVLEQRSDASGRVRFAIALEEPAHWRLSVLDELWCLSESSPLLVEPNQTTSAGDLLLENTPQVLERDWSLRLCLVDAVGRPVHGADVRIAARTYGDRADNLAWTVPLPDTMLEHGDGALASGTSDAAGWLALTGRRSGPVRIRVLPIESALAARHYDCVLREGDQELVLALEAGHSLAGRVVALDGGQPKDLWISIEAGPSAGLRDVIVDEAGQFAVHGLAAGDYWLSASAKGYSRARVPWNSALPSLLLELKGVADERDVGHHMAEIHGHFVDARDTSALALAEGALQMEYLPEDETLDLVHDVVPCHLQSAPRQRMSFGAPAPPSGEFHCTDLPSGRYMLRAKHGDLVAWSSPLVLAEGEMISGLELEFAPGATLSTRVLDAEGRAVAGAFVFLVGIGPYSEQMLRERDAAYRACDGRGFFWANCGMRTDTQGVTRHSALPQGSRVRAVAVHPHYAAYVSEPLVLAPTMTEVVLHLDLPR